MTAEEKIANFMRILCMKEIEYRENAMLEINFRAEALRKYLDNSSEE
jgi:hypothetical protein